MACASRYPSEASWHCALAGEVQNKQGNSPMFSNSNTGFALFAAAIGYKTDRSLVVAKKYCQSMVVHFRARNIWLVESHLLMGRLEAEGGGLSGVKMSTAVTSLLGVAFAVALKADVDDDAKLFPAREDDWGGGVGRVVERRGARRVHRLVDGH